MINVILSSQLLPLLAEGAEAETVVDGLIIPFIVVLVLVAINGFFVAAEFALLGARSSRMEALANDGNKIAGRIQQILEDKYKQNAYLATAQLGITIVTLGLAMYGERKIAHYLEATIIKDLLGDNEALVATVGYVFTISVLTYLHVVLGEMIPKSWALGDANTRSQTLYRPMAWLQSILYIPVTILNAIGAGLLRLMRIKPQPGAHLYSSEEIEQLVSESAVGGLITEEAESIISNILDFNDRDAGQVMTPRPRVEGIPADIAWSDLLKRVTTSRHSRFPVYEEDLDHIIGILHLKDLVGFYRKNEQPANLRDLLRPTPVVPDNQSVSDLLAAFKLQRLHMAIVVDEYGGTAGIVTLEDLVEEIVGEVRDEFDQEVEPIVTIEPGLIEVAGDYLLDQLKEQIFLGEEDSLPDVDTVGGLVVTHLGRPPQKNDTVEIEDAGIEMKVIDVDGRAVDRVQIKYPVVEEESESDDTEHSAEH